ncbi:MAG: response regulator [Caulobacteraceae bacterium]
MFKYIADLLDNRSLSPHGICLLWRPELLWTHVVADAFIFLAYMTIPAALAVILRRRKDIPYGWMIWSFALFITACGFTHFMGIWTLWRPDYGVEALVKVVTALASVVTALALWSLIPLAVSLPSPAQLHRINQELERRIAERDRAIAALEREREDRLKAEQTLVQAQKMEALGQLTGGIAHDFNNLLQGMLGAFDMVTRKAEDPDKVRQYGQGGLAAARRGADLTSKLLAFARTRQLKLEPFLLSEMAGELRDMMSRSMGPQIDLRFDICDEESPVLGDRQQTELALLNLVINARDAMPKGGRVTVRIDRHDAAEDQPDLRPGRYMRLAVIDEGVGMTPEVAQRAFDPFYTTKPAGHATGLGLSQVYGYARQTGGGARIESRPGKGTAVSLFLPSAADAPRDRRARRTSAPAGRALPASRVLVVDDEAAVRQGATAWLEVMGLEPVEAVDGRSALAISDSLKPDLVLLDLVMPEMNGAEVARRLRARWPDIRVVFMTGYADELDTALPRGATVLRKPYGYDDLYRAMADALGEPA